MYQLFRPFTGITRAVARFFTSIRVAAFNNPLAQGQRQLFSQLNYARSVPQTWGRQIFPRGLFGRRRKSDQRADVGDIPEADQRMRDYGKRRGQRVRKAKGAPRRAALAQIHLINRQTGARSVIHLESATGQEAASIRINFEERPPVLLRFTLTDEKVYGSPVLLTYVAGSSVVEVDGAPVDQRAAVKDGTIIRVDELTYELDWVSFGFLPAVTRVNAAWATNVGPLKDINQDAIGVYQHPDAYMFSVADGVSGAYAGEEVSEFAVKYLLAVFKRNVKYPNLSWLEVYRQAYEYINAEVRAFVSAAPGPAGCTLTSIYLRDWIAYVAHVGDSQLFLMRGAGFRKLTQDHNKLVVVDDASTEDLEARRRNILQKAIGKTAHIEPDIFTISLQPRDKLVLLTDGVTRNVSHEEIYQLLSTRRIDEIPELLIELTNTRRNTDNASVIAIDVLERAFEHDDWVARPEDRVWVGGLNYPLYLERPQEIETRYPLAQVGCLVVLAIGIIVGIVYGVSQLWQSMSTAGVILP